MRRLPMTSRFKINYFANDGLTVGIEDTYLTGSPNICYLYKWARESAEEFNSRAEFVREALELGNELAVRDRVTDMTKYLTEKEG